MNLLALALLASCRPFDAEDARREWMGQVLRDADQIWLTENPNGLATKVARMASDPYDFMRGSAAFWYADLARPNESRANTTFLSNPLATAILVVGDPHPENFGTCLPEAEPDPGILPTTSLTLEPVDLDGSVWGPWWLDLRRLELGLSALAAPLPGCDDLCIDSIIAATASAYAQEIVDEASGAGTWDSTAMGAEQGTIVRDLHAKAFADGSTSSELDAITESNGSELRLVYDSSLDANGKGILKLDDEDAELLGHVLAAAAPKLPAGFRRLDAARKYGSGVASLPAKRFVVLWDRGDPSPSDDRLLNLREVIDPPAVLGLDSTIPALFADNAERIQKTGQELWSRPDADPLAGAVQLGAQTFKITSESGWFLTYDHLDIAESWAAGFVSQADLELFGATLGHTLAAAHARGPNAQGDRALPAIAEDIRGRSTDLADDMVGVARADRIRLAADHPLFVDLVAEYGPLLGGDIQPRDVP